LKARDRDPARSPVVCKEIGAVDRGTLTQRDTYFEVPRGRLKLREEPGTGASLIAYERSDRPGQRESHYRIVEVANPDEMREALSAVLGIRAVVSKERRLFTVENVRVHLDRVDDLGDFIEFEAVAADDGDLGHSEGILADLRQSFGIRDADLVRGSYSDLSPTEGRI
jgi:adenylate cyclase class 2